MVVKGNSGPYRPCFGSPSMLVTGLALPYGLPRLFKHTMKNLVMSNAFPDPPISGPHQSATSALPERAWHMTKALSPFGDNVPRVVYATGTLCNSTPDSRVNEGTMAMCWSGMRVAKGFSGCRDVLSTGFSSFRGQNRTHPVKQRARRDDTDEVALSLVSFLDDLVF